MVSNIISKIKLGETFLEDNLEAIQHLNNYMLTSKHLYFKGLLNHKDYQKIKSLCSNELNKLHLCRVDILRSKAEKFREDYKEKCRISKITVEYKNKVIDIALDKLTLEEREILKEYSFKL